MKPSPALLFLAAVLLSSSCATTDSEGDEYAYRLALAAAVPPLDFRAPARPSGELGEYCADFDGRLALEPPALRYLGYLSSGDYRIFVQVLAPENAASEPPAGTAFIFHGFATDSSRYAALARTALESGRHVVLADLPGHGLSSGERGGAPDFSIYGDAVRTVTEGTEAHLPRPFLAIGHSTGATAVMDYTRRGGGAFSAALFYEPLVKTAYQPALSALRFLSRPWLRTLRTSAHTDLGVRRFPVSWFDALRRWERAARSQKSLGLPPTLVMQGTEDAVVANRYNRRFIERRTADFRFLLVEGGSHYEPDSRTPHPALIQGVKDFLGGL